MQLVCFATFTCVYVCVFCVELLRPLAHCEGGYGCFVVGAWRTATVCMVACVCRATAQCLAKCVCNDCASAGLPYYSWVLCAAKLLSVLLSETPPLSCLTHTWQYDGRNQSAMNIRYGQSSKKRRRQSRPAVYPLSFHSLVLTCTTLSSLRTNCTAHTLSHRLASTFPAPAGRWGTLIDAPLGHTKTRECLESTQIMVYFPNPQGDGTCRSCCPLLCV